MGYSINGRHDVRRKRIALVGSIIAGVETHYKNVVEGAKHQDQIEAIAVPVRPYVEDDWIRRLFFVPASTRSTLRQTLCTTPLFRRGRFDAIWSQAAIPLMPWMFTANLIHPLPVVYSMDSTPRQLAGFQEHYNYWGGRSRLKARVRDMLYTAFLKKVMIVNPWTEWAARSFTAHYDVDPARIRVLPPGVDTNSWCPADTRSSRDVPRAIFVGGDFVRKGGDLLLKVFRERFRGRLELDLVTRAELSLEPGVRVHGSLHPNDPRLLRLYQQADFFVLPTRADCFPMAGIEAMSTGLPVVMSKIAGIGEMFQTERQGYHVNVDDGDALAIAMDSLVSRPDVRGAMGSEARLLARSRYDTQLNTAKLLALFEQANRVA